MKAVIIDDEESARDLLANLLKKFHPEVDVLAACSNLESGVESIKKEKPQVVFLDIEMPKYAGYEIGKFFDVLDFEIIFVTAYDKYAIKAFDLAAVDYLLKPIDVEKLDRAIERLKEKLNYSTPKQELNVISKAIKENTIDQIAITEKGYKYFFEIRDVLAIEAQESYSKIYLADGESRMASKNLKHFEKLFADRDDMFRAHKSWIVNLGRVIKLSKTKGVIELEEGITAKLSKYRKDEFEEAIKKAPR